MLAEGLIAGCVTVPVVTDDSAPLLFIPEADCLV